MRIRFGNRSGRSRGTSDKPPTVFGKLCTTLFFTLFFAMGAGFCVFLGFLFFQNLGTYTWDPTEASITHSDIVQERDGDHRFEVRYQYVVDDRPYTGRAYDAPDGNGYAHSDYAQLQRLAVQYPVGAMVTAYVDPSDPSRAILAHPSLWIGLTVFFPLIFVAVGAGGVYFTWFGKTASRKSIAGRSTSKQLSGRWLLRAMGVGFTGIGLVVAYFMLIMPVLRVQRAKSWMPVPATVVASRVVTHRGDDSTTYSVDILYEYEIDGRTLRSNRYHFLTGSSSGRHAKQVVVDAHPPGKEITAYVNPGDPFDAVIDRGYSSDLWFGLIPLVFCVAGVAMLIGSVFVQVGPRQAGGKAWLPDHATVEPAGDPFAVRPATAPGRVTLRPTGSPLGKFLGVTAAAVFWNAITGVFVGIAVNSHMAGNPEWFLTFFIIPFVLIGVGLIGAIGYQFLALFNPKAVLEVGTATPALGDILTIDWRLEGRADRVSALTLSLVGEEHATYQRGTDTVTDKHTFYDETLLKTSDAGEILSGGHLDVLIPADVMHSFEAANNKITWTLRMTGAINRWPDMKNEFGLVIQPINPEKIGRA